jgi:hypothetical protein
MPENKTVRAVLHELKHHAPYTLIGAILGVLFMFVFRNQEKVGEYMFLVAHPGHIVLSAMATAAMFKTRGSAKNFLLILIIGWVGAIGISTLSDVLIPFAGTEMFGLNLPTHSAVMHGPQEHDHQHTEPKQITDDHADHDHTHQPCDHNCTAHEHVHTETCEHTHEHHEHTDACDHAHPHGHNHGHGQLHLPFIHHWYIVNPAAFLGVLIAYFWPATKISHSLHMLISTWASSAFIIKTSDVHIGAAIFAGLAIVLFIAVWVPCCLSDIIFPMLLVKTKNGKSEQGHHHE